MTAFISGAVGGGGGGGGRASVTFIDTRRDNCCGSPICDHIDVPLRYVLKVWFKHKVLRWHPAK